MSSSRKRIYQQQKKIYITYSFYTKNENYITVYMLWGGVMYFRFQWFQTLFKEHWILLQLSHFTYNTCLPDLYSLHWTLRIACLWQEMRFIVSFKIFSVQLEDQNEFSISPHSWNTRHVSSTISVRLQQHGDICTCFMNNLYFPMWQWIIKKCTFVLGKEQHILMVSITVWSQ